MDGLVRILCTVPPEPGMDGMLRRMQTAAARHDHLYPGEMDGLGRLRRKRYVLGLIQMGSAADEAGHRKAVAAQDWVEVARLNAEAEERRRLAEALWEQSGL